MISYSLRSFSSSGIGPSFCDWHLQDHPKHWPVANPCLWQSSLQVDSAAQSANSLGEIYSSLHSQLVAPSLEHVPVTRPRALQVATQKGRPRWHREGRRLLRLSRLILFSLQMQSPSASQIPLVCPRPTQLAEQASSPREHLNPAWTTTSMQQITPTLNTVFMADQDWSDPVQ